MTSKSALIITRRKPGADKTEYGVPFEDGIKYFSTMTEALLWQFFDGLRPDNCPGPDRER